jgi:hypothetical protein
MTNRTVIRCLILLALLNLVDMYVTIALVSINAAEEINPLMNYVLQFGFIPFIAVKSLAVSFVCYVFWKYKEHMLSQIGIYISLFAYLSLILYFSVEML